MKAQKKTKAPRAALYSAAWRACGKPLPGEDPAENDLRSRLEDLLKSGWSIQALETYAFAHQWQRKRRDHVTPAVWRWAVYFASIDTSPGTATFWREYNERNASTE